MERVVTREEASGGVVAAAASGDSTAASSAPSGTAADPGGPGPESTAQAAVAGTGCTAPLKKYTATRFGYAKNGRTVTHVLGEQWCWDGVAGCEVPGSYQVTWAREFRYDGARARYMNAPLNPATMAPYNTTQKPTVWSDYDGDEAYGDFTVSRANPPVVSNTDAYQPGLWNRIGGTPNYLHNDHLGTLRLTTGSTGSPGASRVLTAFGDHIPGSTTTDRFGYVGAYGYQSTVDGGAEVFPFLHVGARYYDPSSGRFLQRDPIGIGGAINVYAYVGNAPTRRIDPKGLRPHDWDPPGWRPKPPWERERDERDRNRRENTTPISPEEMERERQRENNKAVAAGVGIGVLGLVCPFVLPLLPAGAASSGAAASAAATIAGIIAGVAVWE